MNKFNIGDIVKVVDDGELYNTYEWMAGAMKLTNWHWQKYGDLNNGDIGEVVAIRGHELRDDTICIGIKIKGQDYIIGSDGLELVAPKLWAIEVTDENHSVVNAWWMSKVDGSGWIEKWPSGLPIGHTVLSKHWIEVDDSYCYRSGIKKLIGHGHGFEYTPITLEQFIQITKITEQENNMKTLAPNTEIKIGRDLLNQYYDAATKEQREYINNNFKIDGTTTVQGIIGLHDIACETWKPKIKQNHPECFVDPKEFDFSKMVYTKLFNNDVIEALGIGEYGQFLEVRSRGEYQTRAFWLTDEFNWELKKDSTGEWVLIPTRK